MAEVISTPSHEWSEKTLAALQNPTAQTGGYVEAQHTTPVYPAPSASTAAPSTTVPPVAPGVVAPAGNFAYGVGGEHASGDIPVKAQGFVSGGGLGTSPNVQALKANATSNSEGLTRAELAANNAAAAGEDLSALSGRDQAAAQLGKLDLPPHQSGVSQNLTGVAGTPMDTPGRELPGGWGSTKPIPAESSLYEDVTQGLHAVGTAAFSALPAGLVNKISTHETTDKSAAPTTTATGSLSNIFAMAKESFNEVKEDIKAELAAPKTGTASNTSPATLSTNGPSMVDQAKALAHEAYVKAQEAAGLASGKIAMATGTSNPLASHAVAPATSLPTDEFAGAKPGDHSAGVGALPGTSAETGVAILPDEKRVGAMTLPSQEPDAGAAGLAVLPDEANKGGVALPPTSTSSAAPTAGSGIAPPLGAFRDATPIATSAGASKETGIPTEVGTAMAAKPAATVAVGDLGGKAAPTHPETSLSEKALPATPAGASSLDTDHRVPGSEKGAVGSSDAAPAATGISHQRTDSSGSNGKKTGFLSKIKSKINKVEDKIEEKLHHDK